MNNDEIEYVIDTYFSEYRIKEDGKTKYVDVNTENVYQKDDIKPALEKYINEFTDGISDFPDRPIYSYEHIFLQNFYPVNQYGGGKVWTAAEQKQKESILELSDELSRWKNNLDAELNEKIARDQQWYLQPLFIGGFISGIIAYVIWVSLMTSTH